MNVLHSTVVPATRPWVTIDAEVLASVAQACRDNERIRFEYTPREGETAERNVEPHRLVPLGQRWYLLAFDRDRDDWRTFRLDRLSAPWPTRMRFKPRPIPGGDAAEFVLRSIDSRPMRYRVVATLDAPVDEVTAEMRPGEGTVEPAGTERSRFETQGDSLEWLAFRLMWFDVDFEIHEPPELVEYVARLSNRLGRSIDTPTDR